MGYNAKAGSFNIDSSKVATETQSVTGTGFTPKVVIFWWSGSAASSDSVGAGDVNMGFGTMAGSSARWAVASASNDDADTSALSRAYRNDCCIVSYLDGSITADGVADWGSLDANGFTITIDDQFSTDLRVSYLALGGTDLTNVAVGEGTRDTALGQYSVTGLGFQADALLIGFGYRSSSGSEGQAAMSLGMATGSSNQGVAAWGGRNEQDTSWTYRYGYNGEVLAGLYNDAVYPRDAFVSFGADGFTLDQLENTAAYKFGYVALKGGQYEVGDLTTRTDGNDIEENLSGAFEPVAVLFASANCALSTQDTTTAHGRLSIGAASATDERAVQAISDEDNLDTTETAYTNQDDAVYAHVVDDAIDALMDIKSIDADGFTCVMDDVEDTAGCWVTYLAIGAEAAAALSVSILGSDESYWKTGVKVIG